MMTTMNRRTIARLALSSLALGLATIASSTPGAAQSRTGGAPNLMYAGIGLKGYDPVAYFTDGKPARGLEAITATHGGLTWRFANAAHKAAFEKEPGRYLPQYGGFCAWGVANNKLFEIDPVDGWTIANNRLYVVFNGDILKLFKAEQAGLIAKAEQNWPKLNQ